MAVRKVNPLVAELQIKEGLTVRKVKGVLKVVPARQRKAAIAKEKTMVPVYQNGYEIVEESSKFHCKMRGKAMLQKVSGAFVPCIHASLEDAKACMKRNGAIEKINRVVEDDDDLFGSFEDEVDIRRQGGKSEYLDQLGAEREVRERANAKKKTIFILDEKHEIGEIVWSGSLQYRVAEKPNYVSQKEVNELDDLAPNMKSGWYTKVELVA